MSSVNYNKEYNQFWTEREGEMSYANPKIVALNILDKCGSGRILDAGCGMGYLVKEFALLGMDAYGFDVSDNAVESVKKWYNKDKIKQGSMLSIPYPDNYFDIVVSTDVLEHIAEEDIDKALSELRRVTKKYLYLNIATRVDRDFKWHICIHDRQWWENKIISSGFMHSFNRFNADTFSTIDSNELEYIGIYEKTSDNSAGIDPLHSTGYESEMKLAQYNLAFKYITHNSRVIIFSSDNGYGAYITASGSQAKFVYSTSQYFDKRYQNTNILNIEDFNAETGADVILNLTGEDINVDKLHNILKPGGKYIYYHSSDDIELIKKYTHLFDIDEIYTFKKELPRIQKVSYDELDGITNAYIVFVKNPLTKDKIEYEDINGKKWFDLGVYAAGFKRDYNNPFIATSIVYRGLRVHSDSLLVEYCHKVLAESSKESADYGAALCVLGYNYLSKKPNESYKQWLDLYNDYYELNNKSDNLSIIRWICSLSYLSGLISLAAGNQDKAVKSFISCVESKWIEFSALLATKAVDAYYLLGKLELGRDNQEKATDYWTKGIKTAEKSLTNNWLKTLGDFQDPFPAGIPELRDVLDLAVKCSWGLNSLQYNLSKQQYTYLSSTPSYINELNIFRTQWSALTHHSETQYKQIQEMSAELSKWIKSHDNLSNELGSWIKAYNKLESDSKAEIDRLENAAKENSKELDKWVASHNNLSHELESWIKAFNALESDSKAQIENLENIVKENNKELDKWITSHDNLSHELENWIKAYNKLESSSKAEIDRLENAAKENSKELDKWVASHNNLSHELESWIKAFNALESDSKAQIENLENIVKENNKELDKWITSHDNLSQELNRWINAYNALDEKFKHISSEYEKLKSYNAYLESENKNYSEIINDIRAFAREFDASKIGKLYKLITLVKNPALIGETSRLKTLAKIVYRKLRRREIAPNVSTDMRMQQIIAGKPCIYKPALEENFDVIMQVDNFIAGGLENVIIDAANIVNKCGLKCGILILGTAGDALKRVQEMGLPYKILPFQENDYEAFLKNAHVKFIYAHYSFRGANIASRLNIPFVQVIHNTYIWAKTNDVLMNEILDSIQYTSAFFSVSQFVQDYAIATFNIPKEKAVVAPNGINLQRFMQKSKEINSEITKEIRRKHNIPEDAVLYLTVGSIVDQKNHLSLVNAFIKIKDKCPNAYVLFIGKCYDKSILDRIEQLTAEHNIKDRFIYGGLQSNPQAYYQTADIIVHPAFYEGYALVILECLVSNKPVIMSNTGIMAGLDNIKGITLLKPPHDINTLTPNNMTLSEEYIDNLAYYMEKYYYDHPTPDLSKEIIDKMDEEYTYKKYYEVADYFISTGKLDIQRGGEHEAWVMLLKKMYY